MSREDDFAARMTGDATLMAMLPGGVYKASGFTSDQGISRDNEATDDAFDANGWLKTAALVSERPEVPDGNVKDFDTQSLSTIQVVETWFYADGTQASLDPIKGRMIYLFQGWIVDGGFEVDLANVIRDRDRGALAGAALLRMDWAVYSVIGD